MLCSDNARTHKRYHFCHAMLCSRGLCRHAVCICLPVCHVCVFCHNELTYLHFSPSGSHTILLFNTKHNGSIPTGTLLMAALNAGGFGRWGMQKNRDFGPGFIVCCRCRDHIGVISTALPVCGKLWHLPLVVSGQVCLWRETTTKCLRQEASTLRQRQ